MLADVVRPADGGAFFGSIMARSATCSEKPRSGFDGWERPLAAISGGPTRIPEWQALEAARSRADARIEG